MGDNTKMFLKRLCNAAMICGLLAVGITAAQAQNAPQKIRLGLTTGTLSALFADMVVPEYLGYFKQEGLSVEAIPLGGNAAAIAALNAGRVEFYLATAAFQLPIAAKGDSGGIDFFESTYPFKFSMAVKSGGAVQKIADLRGKRVGVSNFGTSDYIIGHAVLKLAGLDPEKDVSWLAVGDGIPSGLALQRGDIDGLFTADYVFGAIEAANIPISYLPLPADVPKVGGVFLATTPEILARHRPWAVGIARAIAKAHIFIRENPEAGAYIFATMFPEAVPKGKSQEEQVRAVMVPLAKRMKLYAPYDESVKKWGTIKQSEWEDERAFAGFDGKVPDLTVFFTNALIDDIDAFDAAKIKNEARAFPLPYKK